MCLVGRRAVTIYDVRLINRNVFRELDTRSGQIAQDLVGNTATTRVVQTDSPHRTECPRRYYCISGRGPGPGIAVVATGRSHE